MFFVVHCVPIRSVALVFGALAAFAANSVLCRLALGHGSIDALSFTLIRIASGATILALVVAVPRGALPWKLGGNWISSLLLIAYAVAFSLAYISLSAGTGALILFSSVQFTMILVGVSRGERPSGIGWFGIALALAGIIVLVMPGLRAPSPLGASLMAVAGAAWGFYSLRGRGVPDAAGTTAGNFALGLPLACFIWIPFSSGSHVTGMGAWLAATSGALTSGLGYVLWYAALPSLTSTRAAVVQLAVPVLAAGAGVLLLREPATLSLLISSILTLGGVALAIQGTRRA